MIIHSCDLPEVTASFYDVHRCSFCNQWWRIQYHKGSYLKYWGATSRIRLMLTGYEPQCRSFLRHNRRHNEQSE